MAPPLLSGSGILIALIKGYQRVISPLLGPCCRFQPTCSQYCIEAVARFGMVKGGWLTLKRLVKCHPLQSGGADSVPAKINKSDN